MKTLKKGFIILLMKLKQYVEDASYDGPFRSMDRDQTATEAVNMK